MRIFSKISVVVLVFLAVAFMLGFTGPVALFAASPATVNLGSSGNFVILAKTGISTTGSTAITGDMGISPAAASYVTGFGLSLTAAGAFSTSGLVTGKIYAPGYENPTPTNLTTAVLDMQTAYTDAAGRAPNVTELGAGNIGGLTLAPGVYKWGTAVTIPTDVTLSGGANDVWIFQIAQNLDISSAKKIILTGGAQASNIFWVVAGQTTLGTTAVFNGNILGQTTIVLNTGAQLNGRALAQAAVTLDASMVTVPTPVASTPSPTPSATPSSTPVPTPNITPSPTPALNLVVCTQDAMQCPNGSYVSRQGPMCTFAACPTTVQQTPIPTASLDAKAALQIQINDLITAIQALKVKTGQQSSISTPSNQQIRAIATNLAQGSRHNNVMLLQQFLISQGKGPAAQALAKNGATMNFGSLTRAALAEFQTNVGISPAMGNFGSITRAYISAHY